MTKLRKHTPEFKGKIAVEALKGQRTLNEIASTHGLHPVLVGQWKKQLVDEARAAFGVSNGKHESAKQQELERAYQEVGRLKMELDWLKKKSGL